MGLPKSIIKKYGISKKAWRVYRGRKRGTKRSSPTKVTKRRKNPTARRRYTRKRSRRKRGLTIPLAPIGGLMATPAVRYMVGELMAGNWESAIMQPARFAGIDPNSGQFNVNELKDNLLPLVIGLAVHKFVGGRPLNLNRTLAAAGVPVIRI